MSSKKIAVRRVRNYNDPKYAQLPMHCLGKPLLTATILVYSITYVYVKVIPDTAGEIFWLVLFRVSSTHTLLDSATSDVVYEPEL